MGAALAGIRVIVTRPREQARALAEAIAAQGGTALIHPAMAILALRPNPQLAAAQARLGQFDYAAFVSANAVEFGLAGIDQLPESVCCLAPGPGTAAALRARGAARVLLPQSSFDSEGLLALPELQTLSGKRVVVFRGDQGRELLADALRSRGAAVEQVACYRRQPASQDIASLAEVLREECAQAIVITSGEALDYLFAALDAQGIEALRALPMFVPHARIADKARDRLCRQVFLTAGADAGVVAGLVQHFGSA